MTDWNPKAHKIFLDATEIVDAGERERFVHEQCEGDAELLREVESFLSANQPAADYFGRATGAMRVPHDEEPTRDSLRAGEGDVIGRYRLLQTIGEGGFGVVYMAEQAQPVRRKVALKVIKPGMDTREVIARFDAERQALALMNHPNISKVLDAGETKDGRPFFVMELVRGIPITEYCDKNNLPTKERLELFSTVCSAVQHAHQKGVIHRDLKPANVMVTLHDGEPVTKVIDFGIAKAIFQRLTEQTIFTRYGQMIGTPQYMSPEQAEMSGIDVDTRSDIYSLGVLLYELLTGSTPIQLARIRNVGMQEMLRLIQEEDSPRPSQRLSSIGAELSIVARKRKAEPARFRRMVRGELDWIVMKAIEKDRRRRYESASAFASDIQHYLNGETVEAVAPTAGYRLRKFVARHQIYVTTGLLLVMTLLAATGFSIRQALLARKSQQAADTARRAAQAAEAEEATQRAEAERQARVVRQLAITQRQQLYASDMHRAYRYLSDGNLQQVRAILEHHLTPDADLGDMRGFEWNYLWDRSRSEELATFNANGHAVVASANGKFLAISEFEKIVIREQVAPWKIVHTVSVPHTADLSFSGDGKFLAAARDQVRDPENRQDITILDTATWSVWKHLPNASFPMKFSRDGKWFAYRYPEGELRDHLQLVRVADWTRQSHYPMGYRGMDWWQGRMELEFSPDSRLLMFLPPLAQRRSRRERTWQFLRMPEQEKDQALSQQIPSSFAIAVSPDGTHLATSAGEKLKRIDVYDLSTGNKVATLDNHTSYVISLEYSADGEHLVSGELGMKLTIWDTLDYQKVKTFGAGNSFDLAITADSQYAVNTTFVDPRSAKVWPIQRANAAAVTGYPVGLTQAGRIVTIELNGQVKVWKDTTLESTFESRLGRPLRGRACVTSDDRLLTTSDDSSCVVVWDLNSHQAAAVPVAQAGQITRIASNPVNPDIVVVATRAGHVAAWSIGRRQELLSILRDFETSDLAFSDDGESLAIVGHVKTLAYEDMVLRVFDIGQGQVRERFPWPCPGRYKSVSFSSDRKYIAAGMGGHFDVFDGKTGRLLKQISAGSRHVSFSPDGKTLATVGNASDVKLWHVPSWIEMLELEAPNIPVVFFDRSNSDRLIIGSHLDDPVRDIDLSGVVTHSDGNGPSGESPLQNQANPAGTRSVRATDG